MFGRSQRKAAKAAKWDAEWKAAHAAAESFVMAYLDARREAARCAAKAKSATSGAQAAYWTQAAKFWFNRAEHIHPVYCGDIFGMDLDYFAFLHVLKAQEVR